MPINDQAGEEPVGAIDGAAPAKRTRRRTTKATVAAESSPPAGAEPGQPTQAPARGRKKATEPPQSGESGDSATEHEEAGRPSRRKAVAKTAAAKTVAKAAKSATKAAKAAKAASVEVTPAAPMPAGGPAPAAAEPTRARGTRKKAAAPAAGPTADAPESAATSAGVSAGAGAPADRGAASSPTAEAPPTKRSRAPQVVPPTAVFFIAPTEAPAAPSATSTPTKAAKEAPAKAAAAKSAPAKAAPTKAAAAKSAPAKAAPTKAAAAKSAPTKAAPTRSAKSTPAKAASAPDAPAAAGDESETSRSRRRRGRRNGEAAEAPLEATEPVATDDDDLDDDEMDASGRRRRRRGRRGRGRGKGVFDEADETTEPAATADEDSDEDDDADGLTRRRRRRRRRGAGGEADSASEDGVVTVVKIREPRPARDEVQGVSGSTRLEAKRQRRRDGREQRRTRPPILSESEFLARREAVDRVMVVRQRPDRTQIAVLEDGILVEHYVTRQSASTMVGNVYLGKVQNVLPSMEAAFVDIGRGRNAVLYAGEVNWDGSGLEGRARSIEQALKSGESVLVQVTKDPVGHKGARLTSHIALSGRHLVYVPNGHASGISRKLSDVERRRLRDVLKNLVPDGAGVIVRTAAEGAAEDDLARDVKRLQAQWDEIQARAADGGAPVLLSSEPDLVIRVVRDMFNEDFREVVIQGTEAYEEVEVYLSQVSPDLVERVRRHPGGPSDAFAEFRVDEQILKALDRKVYLPSGGHLVIDRTEAMTVIDVNTGKYTGAGGNLEETVTRNNLEAAEEIVRQLRLRDVGGIIVIDFIDMVLESNRDLVLRRLTECLGRDRTKHQVTEITSLGLVQMTRKRIGQGLLEAFSEGCEHCKGRGVLIHTEPVSERARGGVAEKVRAVAASVRSGSADNASGGDDAVVDAELPEPNGSTGSDLDDLANADDDGQGSSARRRARRGSTRRRTRP
jgi:ribonuclease E